MGGDPRLTEVRCTSLPNPSSSSVILVRIWSFLVWSWDFFLKLFYSYTFLNKHYFILQFYQVIKLDIHDVQQGILQHTVANLKTFPFAHSPVHYFQDFLNFPAFLSLWELESEEPFRFETGVPKMRRGRRFLLWILIMEVVFWHWAR